jgi:replicative DNA helicase
MDMTVPPQNLEAEQSILGAILLNNKSLYELDTIEPEMFYREAHKMIFKAMIELDRIKEPIDLVTLSNFMKSTSLTNTSTYCARSSKAVNSSNGSSRKESTRNRTLRKSCISS